MWLLLAAGSLYCLEVLLVTIGVIAAIIVRNILLSPLPIDGWRYFESLFAFWFAAMGLIWSVMIALFYFRTRARPSAVSDGPGRLLTRPEAPGLFRIADQMASELQLSRLPEFRADLVGGIVCPGLFIPKRKFLQMVVFGLPALAVLRVPEFTEALRAQLRLSGISPGLRLHVADMHHRLATARERSGRSGGILLPVEFLCQHALQVLAAYTGENATAYSPVLNRIETEFTLYVANHVNPLIVTRHIPPVTEGFRRHWNSLDGAYPAETAILLIESAGALEERLANATIARTEGLERISWEQASTVLLRSWLELAVSVPEPIRELSCGNAASADLLELGHRMYDRAGRLYDPTQLRGEVCRNIALALVAAIKKAGWHFDYEGPGTRYQFSRNSLVLLPFSMADGLLRGDGAEAWQMICTEAGIADLQLG